MAVHTIRLTPTAIKDLENALAYFDEQRNGLGNEFLAEFVKVVTPLLDFPELYPSVRGNIRRGLIRRFRYIFTYTIQGDSIVIARLLHGKRNTRFF